MHANLCENWEIWGKSVAIDASAGCNHDVLGASNWESVILMYLISALELK